MKRTVVLLVLILMGTISNAGILIPINGISKFTKLDFAGKAQNIISYLLKPAFGIEPWQQEWEKVVIEAKKEGKVSVVTDWGPETRTAVINALKKKYGIGVEVSSAGASQMGAKVLAERNAGLYAWDISVHGSNFGVNIMKPAGAFNPAEPALILPEVKDPKAWLGGEFPWFDKAHTMIPFLARLDTNLAINTDLVKPGEITSYRDLLDPKWKGKILLKDPTKIGAGSGWFRENGKNLCLDYFRALAKQEPVILDNERQCVEWLARGKYSVLIAGNGGMLTSFIAKGSPVAIIDTKDSRTLGPSSGIVSLMNRAPHPNAARIFLNWLLTKEGQTIMTQTWGLFSRRLDAPTDHLLTILIPQPGRKYTEYTEASVIADPKVLKACGEIFGPLLAKAQ